MSTPKPPVVVAVVEDHAPSRTALGRLLRAPGFEPALFESAEAYIAASGCARFFRKPVFGSTLMSAIAALANR